MQLRVDSQFTDGIPLPPLNFTSFWISNTLYMYTYDGNASCVSLDMGFGMMRPGKASISSLPFSLPLSQRWPSNLCTVSLLLATLDLLSGRFRFFFVF